MKKLFLSVTLLLGSGLSVASDGNQKQSLLQKLCNVFMEKSHSCHREGADEGILKELKKRGVLEYSKSKAARLCTGRPIIDGK